MLVKFYLFDKGREKRNHLQDVELDFIPKKDEKFIAKDGSRYLIEDVFYDFREDKNNVVAVDCSQTI
jgi:hypothetical protein